MVWRSDADRIRDAIRTLEEIRDGVEGRDRDGLTWAVGFLAGTVLPNVARYRVEREQRYFGFLTNDGRVCVRVWSRQDMADELDRHAIEDVRRVVRPFYATGTLDAMTKAADILRREDGIHIDPEEAMRRNYRGTL